MHILVVGVDHTTASIEFRERLACTVRQVPQVLLAAQQISQECLLLSTCNRSELYAVCVDAEQGREGLLQVFSETRQVAYEELCERCYTFFDAEAVEHIFGVTCGLYSLVPGEPQIQGQVVEALEIAQGSGYSGPILSALFRSAISVGKRARTETGISRSAASVSHVAVQLARRLFPDISTARVLLIGSGQMSELAARNLRDNGARQLVIINRTHANAQNLALSLGAVQRKFSELSSALVDADIVISSTTAPHAIITPELMHQVMEMRNGRSLLFIDIALPRDVDAAVSEIAGVYLYNIDDLQTEVQRGIHLRLLEAERVRAIIAEEAVVFNRWLASLSVVDTISDLRRQAEELRQQELARTMRQLSPTLSERERSAVQELTMRLMNKMLHMPMTRLKAAAAVGEGHAYAEAIRYLFDLEQENESNYDRDAGQQARNDTNRVGDRVSPSAVAHS